MYKISVILTTYNCDRIIKKTLDSILNQDEVDKKFKLELIVVDDCSIDRTVEIIKTKNVLFFSTKKNTGGPNKGRNIGLKHSSGDFICIADQDDYWKPNRIISLLPFCEKYPIVTSGFFVVNNKNKKNSVRVKENNEGFIYYRKNETFIKILKKSKKGQNTYLGSIIFSKKLKKFIFEEYFGAVDYDWLLKIFYQNESLEICKPLYVRNVNDKNLSLNEAYRTKDFFFSLMTIEKYFDDYPTEVKKANLRIHGSRARYYYLTNNMVLARFYFLQSEKNLKTFFYYLSTFIGSNWVKRNFNVFG